ncbi:hypothetical protein [Streptomyces sp. NPDC048489]|uniref:hypothetical protein n=1 Tax=Streptomyces sp. NPDC048489 TaxID=3154504 RepID=UPI00343A2F21
MRQRRDGNTAGMPCGSGPTVAAARVARLATVRRNDRPGIAGGPSGTGRREKRVSPGAVGAIPRAVRATGSVRFGPVGTAAPHPNRYDPPGSPADESGSRPPGPLPPLFAHPQYPSTTIRLVRKDSHV